MAKRKTNYAWVKVNTEQMTVNMEGSIMGCARDLMLLLTLEQMERLLTVVNADLQKRRDAEASLEAIK